MIGKEVPGEKQDFNAWSPYQSSLFLYVKRGGERLKILDFGIAQQQRVRTSSTLA
jgi:hypothetical protein